MGDIYTSIPRVAEKDIQKPASTIAPGEKRTIMNPAIDNDVRESGRPDIRIDRYTMSNIITDLVAEIENPVKAR